MSAVQVYSQKEVSSWLQSAALDSPELLLNNQAAVFRAFEMPSSPEETVQIPPRLAIDNPLHTMLFMPSRAAGITAAKIVAVPKPGKAPSGIPGVTLIFDDTSGKLVAMVDASVLTPARTAAGSVLATTLIVPPETEIRTLAIYGGGQQAFWHALLIASVYRSLATVRFIPPPGRGVSATLTGTADRLRAALGGRKIEVTVDSDDAHLAQADVICTCTPSSTPLFRPDAVKPGVHLILVGSYKPHMQEVPPELVKAVAKAGTLILDSVEAAATEAGDLIKAGVPASEGLALGSLLTEQSPSEGDLWGPAKHVNQLRAARKAGASSMFKSVGVGAQDVAIAHLVQSNAEAGQVVYL